MEEVSKQLGKMITNFDDFLKPKSIFIRSRLARVSGFFKAWFARVSKVVIKSFKENLYKDNLLK